MLGGLKMAAGMGNFRVGPSSDRNPGIWSLHETQ
jgi:hypothetical protein